MKVFSRKTQAITLLLATTATILFIIKTHYEASHSTDAYMGNLRHSHLAPHDILAAEAEPVATTAPSVKLQKEDEAGNVSLLRSESEVAPDLPPSSAPRNHDNVTLRLESKVAPVPDDETSAVVGSNIAPSSESEYHDEHNQEEIQVSDLASIPKTTGKNLGMSCSENQSLMLTEACMQYNARRIARAFPYRPKDYWCIPTTARGKQSKNEQNQWQGLLYVKVPKVSSSSLAGVALRIHNHTGCEAQWEHRLAKTFQPKTNQTFLLGSMRKPSSRDLSHIQFFNFAGKFGERVGDGTHQLSAQDYYDHGLYWKGHHSMDLSKGQGGYQYKWLTLESVKSKSIFDESYVNEPLRNPTNTHKKLGRLLQEYNFFVIVERMDESMVALALLLGLDISSTLVAASAKVSGSYALAYRGRDAGRCIRRRSFDVPQEVHDHMKENRYLGLTYADQILYRASNISLDLTIQETIGPKIFDKALEEYRFLKEKAIDYCGSRLSSGCYANGTKILPVEPCYVADFGCGYKCLDEVVEKSRAGEL
jgi:hypothetical protein